MLPQQATRNMPDDARRNSSVTEADQLAWIWPEWSANHVTSRSIWPFAGYQ